MSTRRTWAFAVEMLDHHERGLDAAALALRRARDPVGAAPRET